VIFDYFIGIPTPKVKEEEEEEEVRKNY